MAGLEDQRSLAQGRTIFHFREEEAKEAAAEEEDEEVVVVAREIVDVRVVSVVEFFDTHSTTTSLVVA